MSGFFINMAHFTDDPENQRILLLMAEGLEGETPDQTCPGCGEQRDGCRRFDCPSASERRP